MPTYQNSCLHGLAILLFISSQSLASVLEIKEPRFEPMQAGKNVLHVSVTNHSDKDQILWIHVYTRSPELGKSGIGWGTGIPETIAANQTHEVRYAYKIQGPVTDQTWLRVTTYHAGSAQDFDQDLWRKAQHKPVYKKRYQAQDLQQAQPSNAPLTSQDQRTKTITTAFRQTQTDLCQQKYQKVWLAFTPDYRFAEFQGKEVDAFLKVMNPTHPTHTIFHWEKEAFLRLEPKQVSTIQDHCLLQALDPISQETWSLTYIQDQSGAWHIDNLVGHTMPCQRWNTWEARLLPTLQHHSTDHFDIYTFIGSTAARNIATICQQREKALTEVASFLNLPIIPAELRLRLIFFEDKQRKLYETGHQGMGWAYDQTTVEIYNDQESLDPFHETTHNLASHIGHPPALFSEGLAVYMSERLGAPALEDLSGGDQTVDQRTRELYHAKTWIPLEELITYTEIGSKESQPSIAYAEAASFVKFLIETYGKASFLQAYAQLKSSNNKQTHEKNLAILAHIYDHSPDELKKQWQGTLQ